jgi:hypothetical protein
MAGGFTGSCREILSLVHIGPKYQVLCMNSCCVRDWLLVTDITTGALHEQLLRS